MESKGIGTKIYEVNETNEHELSSNDKTDANTPAESPIAEGEGESAETVDNSTIDTTEALEQTSISDELPIDSTWDDYTSAAPAASSGPIDEDFQYQGELVHKKVVFFLAETKTKEVTISHEHLDYTWMDYNTSMEKTTFDNAKTVLTRAQMLLSKTL